MRSFGASLILGLLLATAAPAMAQPPPPPPRPAPPLPDTSTSRGRAGLPWFPISRQLAEEFRARLNRAANFRLSGNCVAWAVEIAAARALVSQYVFAHSEIRPPGAMPDFIGRELRDVAEFYERLIDQEAAQPCPPDATTPPPIEVIPPTTEPALPPVSGAQPRSNAVINGAMTAMDLAAALCDREAWETARARAIAAIERQLETETDPALRLRLNQLKNNLRNTRFPACADPPPPPAEAVQPPPPPPPPPPVGAILSPPVGYGVQDRLTPGVTHDGGAAMWTPRTSLGLSAGYGVMTIPRTGYGFNRNGPPPEPDQPAAFSERRVPIWNFTGRARSGRFALLVGYAEGDASNRTEIAPSTTGGQQGTVNTALPQSGITGAAANRGLTVDTNVSVREYSARFYIDIMDMFPDQRGNAVHSVGREREVIRDVSLGVGFIHRDRDHFGEVNIPGIPAGTPPVVNQVIEQDVGEWEIGASLGGHLAVPLGRDAQLTLGVEGRLNYFDYDLDTTQTNIQLVGDLAFTLDQEDSKNGVSARGSASAELSYVISRSRRADGRQQAFEVFMAAEASIDSRRAQANNPFSGTAVQNGETSFLGTDDAFDWWVGGGIRIVWGR